jgi:DNA-binding NarL/FixJ family response regulator
MEISIILADDQKIVLEGLQAVIGKMQDMRVVARATDGRTAVELVKQYAPHVALLDVLLPQLNGFEATYQILAAKLKTKVIGLSVHSNPLFIRRMLKVGASGYLLKDCTPQELEKAIHTVIHNQRYFSPRITDLVINDYLDIHSGAADTVMTLLTAREREVLQDIAEGKSTKQIAAFFNVSTKTIETHKQKIMGKLKLYSIAELTKFAIREGLTTL